MLFYSMAATKLKAFTLILVPYAAFIGAPFIQWLADKPKRKFITLTLLLIASIKLYVSYFGTHQNTLAIERAEKFRNFTLSIKPRLSENAVIFNAPEFMYPDMIFYTHVTSYDRPPAMEEIVKLEELGKEIYVLIPPGQEIDPSVLNRTTNIPADSIQFYYPNQK